ncbi:hydantoinase/oxoprolinase family protein [Salicibibacter cibarius]|uniref:Hydantoinase/oxoprolinase family protein n=1 Tax=Salicibibacter cibarius TaxID=2743000 RepID=A0A7T6Z703_9BACI|nr:hydantoinase/oxoprolinase family protein [Salicibibacter cibarius]QQK77946.1 hydantoinase/oxoprolinase family protein [Salicibibacter cibarius]
MTSIKVGVDIGGTFTDFVFLESQGNRSFGKTLTTYPDPSDGFINGLEENLQKFEYRYEDIDTIIHGTTLVVNALIERKGAKTALITTEGFRDQLEIATESRYDLYDLFVDNPLPLVPRELRYTVKERMLNDGTVLEPLDETGVKETFRRLREDGVEAVAVCFLHSYRNMAHETRVREIAEEVAPELYISLSGEVSPEIREYPRTSTTVANVFVQPLVQRYLSNLETALQARGFSGNFLMMLSGGGTCTVETAMRFPIRILESGPVGGTIAGAYYSERSRLGQLLVFDMGGTTAKASLVDDGKPLTTNEFEVGRAERFMKGSGMPVKVPVVEMIEIGAGGGSIAHVNRLGLLKVGPESAGSNPGPASYDLGGTRPTVTDADLILGYLNPDYFLGGDMPLNKKRAYAAIEKEVAKPLGLDVVEAAWGIHEVVNENMASASRIHAVEKGKDIRDYPLFASGGAGPVHISHVAEILGVETVLLPVGAGVNSAFGFLAAPLAFDFVRSFYGRLKTLEWNDVTALYEEMEQEGKVLLAQAGVTEEIETLRYAEMKYAGQTHEIAVPIPAGALTVQSIPEVMANFKMEYAKRYAEANEDMVIEALNWRVVVRGPEPHIYLRASENQATAAASPKAHRDVYFRAYKSFQQTPVYERSTLAPGTAFQGPAIVEERESTLVVNPGFLLKVDELSNLWMTKEGAHG